MAVGQVGKVIVRVISDLSEALDLSSVIDSLNKTYTNDLGNGAGSGQANDVFHDQRTLAASATEDLDLAGVLANALGDTLTFASIKAIIIQAAAANTNAVNVTRPATNGLVAFIAAGDGVAIKPGGLFVLTAPGAGITVTASTGDLLTITNAAGGTSVTYDVIIIGVRA